MKVDVTSIIRDHLRTLYNARTGKSSLGDAVIFFLLPALAGGFSFLLKFSVAQEFYNVSITFFGIFIALLLNIQVAIFAIFQRKWDLPKDKKLAEIAFEKMTSRNLLLKELNANISYLVLFCCAALLVAVVFYVLKWSAWVAPSFVVIMYSHFFFTLIMIVKRSHALFQMEYSA
ncbi:hypothetical protein [Caulobacter sp. Root1472]|uniref:hypothetical protein n=1 Tax=Caulobacter sp. Root1472 TaxID=1736470 RepID=UPI0009EA7E06|nr:hypothetical protein [Caulobacter sp. Root1472]